MLLKLSNEVLEEIFISVYKEKKEQDGNWTGHVQHKIMEVTEHPGNGYTVKLRAKNGKHHKERCKSYVHD